MEYFAGARSEFQYLSFDSKHHMLIIYSFIFCNFFILVMVVPRNTGYEPKIQARDEQSV